jgi:hypothetical protein
MREGAPFPLPLRREQPIGRSRVDGSKQPDQTEPNEVRTVAILKAAKEARNAARCEVDEIRTKRERAYSWMSGSRERPIARSRVGSSKQPK